MVSLLTFSTSNSFDFTNEFFPNFFLSSGSFANWSIASYKEFESLPSNKQDEIIEKRINSMPRPLRIYLSDFIKNEAFDLSESNELLNKLENFDNLEDVKNNKKINKREKLKR